MAFQKRYEKRQSDNSSGMWSNAPSTFNAKPDTTHSNRDDFYRREPDIAHFKQEDAFSSRTEPPPRHDNSSRDDISRDPDKTLFQLEHPFKSRDEPQQPVSDADGLYRREPDRTQFSHQDHSRNRTEFRQARSDRDDFYRREPDRILFKPEDSLKNRTETRRATSDRDDFHRREPDMATFKGKDPLTRDHRPLLPSPKRAPLDQPTRDRYPPEETMNRAEPRRSPLLNHRELSQPLHPDETRVRYPEENRSRMEPRPSALPTREELYKPLLPDPSRRSYLDRGAVDRRELVQTDPNKSENYRLNQIEREPHRSLLPTPNARLRDPIISRDELTRQTQRPSTSYTDSTATTITEFQKVQRLRENLAYLRGVSSERARSTVVREPLLRAPVAQPQPPNNLSQKVNEGINKLKTFLALHSQLKKNQKDVTLKPPSARVTEVRHFVPEEYRQHLVR